MHKEMEVYVDDMITKSMAREDRLTGFQKIFERLRKFDLNFNPNKWVFDATSNKLLGFIVSQLEIEIDSSKIKAIRNASIKQRERSQSFSWYYEYIVCFIAKLTTTCEPLFKRLEN